MRRRNRRRGRPKAAERPILKTAPRPGWYNPPVDYTNKLSKEEFEWLRKFEKKELDRSRDLDRRDVELLLSEIQDNSLTAAEDSPEDAYIAAIDLKKQRPPK